MSDKKPGWTVLYNIPGDYVGRGWEFFDNYDQALRRYKELPALNYVGTLRPFCNSVDRVNMGAAHQEVMSVEGNSQA